MTSIIDLRPGEFLPEFNYQYSLFGGLKLGGRILQPTLLQVISEDSLRDSRNVERVEDFSRCSKGPIDANIQPQ